jgi:hypothetical protein
MPDHRGRGGPPRLAHPMTRAHILRVALSGALIGSPAPAAAAVCVPRVPVMTAHPDARHVVLMATATADTVEAGWGDVGAAELVRRPRGWRGKPVYGQWAEATRIAGPGAEGLAPGRVVLVPWYVGCSENFPWAESFAWMRPGVTDVVVARLRRRDVWIGGVPTFDVLRTDLVYRTGVAHSRPGWASTVEERFGLYATLPTVDALAADPWRAIAPMRAWLTANPAGASAEQNRYVSNGIYRHAANRSVRARPSPLAGTYRIEVSRTGGPAHVVYGRTMEIPSDALFLSDTPHPVFPEGAAGYRLEIFFSRDASGLPPPRPGRLTRWWRRVAGGDRGGRGDQMEVWLPGRQEADGTRRFRGHLGLWNVTHALFPDDPEFRTMIDAWSRREFDNMRMPNARGEAIAHPDGSVEWREVLDVAPGQAVTIRATRVSGVALVEAPAR